MKNNGSQDIDIKQRKSIDAIPDNDIHNFKPFIVNINYNKRSLDSLLDLRKKQNSTSTLPFKRSFDSLLDYVNLSMKENFNPKKKNYKVKRSKSDNSLYQIVTTINIKSKINKSLSETNIENKYIKEVKKEIKKEIKKIKNRVSFNESVSVVLIPTKSEYINHNLKDILWYSSTDYIRFKNECVFKIRNNFEVYNVKSFSVDSPKINNRKKI